MNRTEALNTLRLDESADGRTVESAYWTLVRRAQRRAETDTDAQTEIDRLNEAYGALAPADRPRRWATQAGTSGGGMGFAMLDAFADWVAAEAFRTRARWSGRNPEIAMIGGSGVVLAAVALGAGASVAVTFVAAGVLLAAIWSPWRRVE